MGDDVWKRVQDIRAWSWNDGEELQTDMSRHVHEGILASAVWAPLHVASYQENLKEVRRLIERGAFIDQQDCNGRTALHLAADRGNLKVMNYLIENRAVIDLRNDNGATALHIAAERGHLNIVKRLVTSGAAIDEKSMNGWTPLHYSAYQNHIDVVEFLLLQGAGIDFQSSANMTPLFVAALNGNFGMVELLIDRGVVVDGTCVDGWTISSLAELYGEMNQIAHHLNVDALTSVPKWFIDPSHVTIDESPILNQASSASIYIGRWLGTSVAIKRVTTVSQTSKSRFRREVSIWHKLRHPHVIKFFGACHVGEPSFVFEYASNGQMQTYLSAIEDIRGKWKMLHGVASGLLYLHERCIVHGDLRCDNILVGSDGKAKLTGFASSEGFQDGQGYIRWMAPECLYGMTASLASDIYALGMVIIEVVTGELPWGNTTTENAVISNVKHGNLPNRPDQFNDEQWYLVTRMCCFATQDRMQILDVVNALQDFANKEVIGPTEQTDSSFLYDIPLEHYRVADMNDIPVKIVHERVKAFLVNMSSSDQMISQQVFDRLFDIHNQMEAMERVPEKILPRYSKTLVHLYNCISSAKYTDTMVRFVVSRQVGDMIFFLHNEIDHLMKLMGLSNHDPIHDWNAGWNEYRLQQIKDFEAALHNFNVLLDEWDDKKVRVEALTCLLFELTTHRSRYPSLPQSVFDNARSQVITALGSSLPAWFIPAYEITFDEFGAFNRGAFSSVHFGIWMGAKVVIKKALISDDDHPSMFYHEASIWWQLKHPHIVQLFGACHVGHPFFVCEYASGGELDTYLRTRDYQHDTWKRLYEAALGLQYLHTLNIIHGDLKCNNIMIGADGLTKLIDFGLSLVAIDPRADESGPVGAVRWKAPEILNGECPTFASDIYSFAMCIIEAVSGEYPWGYIDDAVIRFRVRRGELPERSEFFSDSEWDLVVQMCCFDPHKRLLISDVIPILQKFAEDTDFQRWGLDRHLEVDSALASFPAVSVASSLSFASNSSNSSAPSSYNGSHDQKEMYPWSAKSTLAVLEETRLLCEKLDNANIANHHVYVRLVDVFDLVKHSEVKDIASFINRYMKMLTRFYNHLKTSKETPVARQNQDEQQLPSLAPFHQELDQLLEILRKFVLSKISDIHKWEYPWGIHNQNRIVLDCIQKLCGEMNRVNATNHHVLDRLLDIQSLVEQTDIDTEEKPFNDYRKLLFGFYNDLTVSMKGGAMTRFAATRLSHENNYGFHVLLDRLLEKYSLSKENDVHDWNPQWNQDFDAQGQFLITDIYAKAGKRDDATDIIEHLEGLTNLQFEITERSLMLEPSVLDDIQIAFPEMKSIDIPKWYIPCYEVKFDDFNAFGSDKSGLVHFGTWFGMNVVVKKVYLNKAYGTEQFTADVTNWYQSMHPHLVKLFGACHVGTQPFIVCQYASKGQLDSYVMRNKGDIWGRLHEAALGLQHLHEHNIVHGHLTTGDILVGRDGLTKLTNCGLKSTTESSTMEEAYMNNARWRWKAPECLSGGASTCKSDVYAFGVCIVEVVSGALPWGTTVPDAVVRVHMEKDELPQRPDTFDETQWDLVKRMCCLEPERRLTITDVVHELKTIADQEAGGLYDMKWSRNDMSNTEFYIRELSRSISEVLKWIKFLCDNKTPARDLNKQIYTRLHDIFAQIQTSNHKARGSLVHIYKKILVRYLKELKQTNTKSIMTMFAASRQLAENNFGVHEQLDRLLDSYGLTRNELSHDWRTTWKEHREQQITRFAAKLSDISLFFASFDGEYSQEDVWTCLLFELNNHYASYLSIPKSIIRNTCKAITLKRGAAIEQWFIPLYAIQYDDIDKIGEGASGIVYLGAWRDATVVVKKLMDNKDHQVFYDEVNTWYQLNHENVAKLYGACHIEGKIFVSEYASNGQLCTFVHKKEHKHEMWGKLYETALGLHYLHTNNIVHGDLKYDNILIGADGKAKLIDFGLSSPSSINSSKGESHGTSHQKADKNTGALRWRAPEVLRGEEPSFASDVFSFGMCILQAVTGKFPWGNDLPDAAVRYYVNIKQRLPPELADFDKQDRELITKMCRFEPGNRLEMFQVVGELQIRRDQEREALR